MQITEQLRVLFLGRHYVSFSVAVAFGLSFDDFELAAQDVQSPDEELISNPFISSTAKVVRTVNPELVGQGALLAACIGAAILDVRVAEDASITLLFENGVALKFPTDTPVVDWHWAITEDGKDPYLGCIMACFSPGEIQGSISDKYFKVDHSAIGEIKC
jgi:hypothetical protein